MAREIKDARIVEATRLANSASGNPRWVLVIDSPETGIDAYQTSADASCSYAVQNAMGRGNEGRLYTLRLTPKDRITHIIRQDGESAAQWPKAGA
jgi:hypothetical protein